VGESNNICPDSDIIDSFLCDMVGAIETDHGRGESPHGKGTRLKGSDLVRGATVDALGEREGEEVLDGVEYGEGGDEQLPARQPTRVLGNKLGEPT